MMKNEKECMMTYKSDEIGYFKSGMPYNKFGSGPETLVIFQGLMFVNKPMPAFLSGQFVKMYGSLEKKYTIYVINRKPGTPEGASMKDISDSYAETIRNEFGGPVDILGVSTGGSIVQQFSADHPELVGKVVIHSSAHSLSDSAKEGQMQVARLARQKKWRKAYSALMEVTLPKMGIKRLLLKPFYGLMSLFGGAFFGKPKENPFDVAIMIEAEDKHAFKERLNKIKAPALVIAGENDPFYTPEIFHETAEGIPDCRLILYKGMGHPAQGDKFKKDLMKFLEKKG